MEEKVATQHVTAGKHLHGECGSPDLFFVPA